ncbi:MAG: hypothetical protein AB7G44_08530 [Bacteroidia bacterium]
MATQNETKNALIEQIISDLEQKKMLVEERTASPAIYHEIQEILEMSLGEQGSDRIKANFAKYGFNSWADFYRDMKQEGRTGIPEVEGSLLGKIDLLISRLKSEKE